MDIVYLVSHEFDYSKRMYNGDCGPEYAESLGLSSVCWKDFENIKGLNAFVDTRIQQAEIDELESLIIRKKDCKFLMAVTDPYIENENDNPYMQLLFRLSNQSHVCIVSKYQPEEIIKDLLHLYTEKRFLTLNYVYDPAKEISISSRKKNKILFSGATYKEIYPERFIFLKRTRRNICRFYIDLLIHPGYPDTGGKLQHKIIGDEYIKFVGQYKYMFISPSRCSLEFLKYREAAYAGVLPIGMCPKTFTNEMERAFFKINPKNPILDLIKLFFMSKCEYQQRVIAYRESFRLQRSKESQKQKLIKFLST